MITAHSLLKTQEKNHSTPEIYDADNTTNQFKPNIDTRLLQRSTSTTTTLLKLPLSGKEYLCFKVEGKTAWEEQCSKSRALTRRIDLIIDI